MVGEVFVIVGDAALAHPEDVLSLIPLQVLFPWDGICTKAAVLINAQNFITEDRIPDGQSPGLDIS